MGLAYEWVDFAGGRVRFHGLVRGGDERGHDTFAVDHAGRIAYGEMKATFAGVEISTEVISYGFADPDSVGAPQGKDAFTSQEAAVIERLIREWVAAVVERSSEDDKPSVLSTTPPDRVTGIVAFRPGWILIDDVTSRVAT